LCSLERALEVERADVAALQARLANRDSAPEKADWREAQTQRELAFDASDSFDPEDAAKSMGAGGKVWVLAEVQQQEELRLRDQLKRAEERHENALAEHDARAQDDLERLRASLRLSAMEQLQEEREQHEEEIRALELSANERSSEEGKKDVR
jgi:hypothetical protein